MEQRRAGQGAGEQGSRGAGEQGAAQAGVLRGDTCAPTLGFEPDWACLSLLADADLQKRIEKAVKVLRCNVEGLQNLDTLFEAGGFVLEVVTRTRTQSRLHAHTKTHKDTHTKRVSEGGGEGGTHRASRNRYF